MKRSSLCMLVLLLLNMPAFAQQNFLTEGNAFLNTGHADKAEKVFRDGIKADPANLTYQCQLGLALMNQQKFTEAQQVLDKVLKADPGFVAAIWYLGINNFYSGKNRDAIRYFEKSLTMIAKNSGKYYSANWFIGKSYSNLLKTEGLTYAETDRMFTCYEEYLRLQPNAEDAKEIKEYLAAKKKKRPSSNVKKWVDL